MGGGGYAKGAGTVFVRIMGFEPEMLQPQPEVLHILVTSVVEPVQS